MRIALAACLALMLTAAAHAAAHAAPAAKRLFPELSAADEKAAVFVLGNVLFTLYHEIGHALVHAFDIPVLGREEDAVDGLAAVLMIPETPDPLMDALVIAAADGWALTARRADGRKLSYWDEHSLDEQRINPQRQAYFGEHRPASTLVQVTALVDPRMKVEIEGVAYVGS